MCARVCVTVIDLSGINVKYLFYRETCGFGPWNTAHKQITMKYCPYVNYQVYVAGFISLYMMTLPNWLSFLAKFMIVIYACETNMAQTSHNIIVPVGNGWLTGWMAGCRCQYRRMLGHSFFSYIAKRFRSYKYKHRVVWGINITTLYFVLMWHYAFHFLFNHSWPYVSIWVRWVEWVDVTLHLGSGRFVVDSMP